MHSFSPATPTLRGCTQLPLARHQLRCIVQNGKGNDRQLLCLPFLRSSRQVDCASKNLQLSDLYVLIKFLVPLSKYLKKSIDLGKVCWFELFYYLSDFSRQKVTTTTTTMTTTTTTTTTTKTTTTTTTTTETTVFPTSATVTATTATTTTITTTTTTKAAEKNQEQNRLLIFLI